MSHSVCDPWSLVSSSVCIPKSKQGKTSTSDDSSVWVPKSMHPGGSRCSIMKSQSTAAAVLVPLPVMVGGAAVWVPKSTDAMERAATKSHVLSLAEDVVCVPNSQLWASGWVWQPWVIVPATAVWVPKLRNCSVKSLKSVCVARSVRQGSV